MHFDVITLFPELIKDVSAYGILNRAMNKGVCSINCWNPRDYSDDRYRTVDDRPYGGGPGMVMMAQPIARAIQAAKEQQDVPSKVVYLSPQGEKISQQRLHDQLTEKGLVLVCGRYEGIDERLIETEVDEQWSIGDYVLAGGELPAMVLIEAMVRLLPGALGNEASSDQDSFSHELLDWPHYTRPDDYQGHVVPEVLLSGNHREIERWRLKQSLVRTFNRRPDLLESKVLTQQEKNLLDEYKQETGEQ